MDDRISHDHPTVETVDGTVERFGRTTRPTIRLPNGLAVQAGDLLRVVAGDREYRTVVESRAEGVLAITTLAESPRQARTPGSGPNVLPDWIRERDLDFGRTVHVDVVATGFRYGLRAPGETATYATGAPDDDLSSIAEQFDWDD